MICFIKKAVLSSNIHENLHDAVSCIMITDIMLGNDNNNFNLIKYAKEIASKVTELTKMRPSAIDSAEMYQKYFAGANTILFMRNWAMFIGQLD